MIIQKTDSHEERKILIGLIVNPLFLGRVASKYEKNMFRVKWSNLISKWCVDFFEKYDDAPMVHIESLFDSWSSKTKDKESVRFVERFLQSLSNQYKREAKSSNTQYLVDLAGDYFNRVRLERLVGRVQGDIDTGDLEKAQGRVSDFGHIEMGSGRGVDVLQESAVIKEAFESKRESIVRYSGALGKFFNDALERDALISFMGPEKRGKTFWLLDVAFRAMNQRKKVAFFEVGDMSQNQIIRRLMIRVSKRPLLRGSVMVPTFIEKCSDGRSVELDYKHRKFDKNLSWRKAWKYCKNIMSNGVRSENSYLRLSCHPNSSINVRGIREVLRVWERDGWIPDVIVIDYADILKMDDSYRDSRGPINETWKQLRSLSQSQHCLVVTATQADAASYDLDLLGKKNFSEDKRKLAHVTGMVGLNQTIEEKERGIMRLNWIVLRESSFSESKVVYVAGCLGIANPAMKSTF